MKAGDEYEYIKKTEEGGTCKTLLCVDEYKEFVLQNMITYL